MAIPMVVSGLMNRRALLQAELEYHERKVAFCKIAIGHFTATLDLYEETKDAKVIRRRYTSNNCARIFAHGLVTNTVMDVLRNADGPLTTGETIDRMMLLLGSGLSPKDELVFRRNIRTTLARKRRQGILKSNLIGGRNRNYAIADRHVPRKNRQGPSVGN
jgi:hypothetical protein